MPNAPGFLINSILPLWPVVLWPGKCLRGCSYGTPLGPSILFPATRAPPGLPPACLEHWLPLCWVDSWCHSEPPVPSGEKVLQHHPRGHLQHARSSRDSWFLLPQSGLWGRYQWFRSARCPLILHSYELLLQDLLVPVELLPSLMVMGLCLALSHPNLPLEVPNLSLHSPQASLYGFGCSLSQTLEAREEISGTHDYAVLIKKTMDQH